MKEKELNLPRCLVPRYRKYCYTFWLYNKCHLLAKTVKIKDRPCKQLLTPLIAL